MMEPKPAAPPAAPALICLADFGGDSTAWLEALYQAYRSSLFDSNAYVCGVVVTHKIDPEYDGKPATFWHVVSEGDVEAERLIEPRRAERVRSIRWILDLAGTEHCRWWLQERRSRKGREVRLALATPDFDYLVILAIRKRKLVLWTAYPVVYLDQRAKLRREADRFAADNANARLRDTLTRIT